MTRARDETAHPAPHRSRVATWEALFGVWAGPAAWFVQFNVLYGFASAPCFDAGERLVPRTPSSAVPALVGVACLLVAAAAMWLAVKLLRRTRGETGGDKQFLVETGHGRTRYLALWGIAFSSLFLVLIVFNLAIQLGGSACAE